jgi:hypothetical protein
LGVAGWVAVGWAVVGWVVGWEGVALAVEGTWGEVKAW